VAFSNSAPAAKSSINSDSVRDRPLPNRTNVTTYQPVFYSGGLQLIALTAHSVGVSSESS
jgi:hypothetical protein